MVGCPQRFETALLSSARHMGHYARIAERPEPHRYNADLHSDQPPAIVDCVEMPRAPASGLMELFTATIRRGPIAALISLSLASVVARSLTQRIFLFRGGNAY